MRRPPILYANRPSILSNPFEGRPKIAAPRAWVLYTHWLPGDVTPYILRCAGLGIDEAEAIERWRQRLLSILPRLRGHVIRCGCRAGGQWCHVPVLRRAIGEGA